MALQSMTGFARASASFDGTDIAWELKSVNGKGLDTRVRLPQGMERLEHLRAHGNSERAFGWDGLAGAEAWKTRACA